MIVIRLLGGIGNQLFQHAIGRKLSLEKNTELKFDVSPLNTSKSRNYSLNNFSILQNFAHIKDYAEILLNYGLNIPKKIFKFDRSKREILFPIYKEKTPSFDSDIFQASSYCYIWGYWQSEKYFKNISNILREDLKFRHEPDSINSELIKEIDEKMSVCIHIRRGDYIGNQKFAKLFGTCPISYYQDAINRLQSQIDKTHFFVFSDDSEWVQKNLNLKTTPTKYISHNIGQPIEDLRLMSRCKHFIIANSSFSWWGAWLSEYKNKIVYAPSEWCKDKKIEPKDIIPDEWKKLEVELE